MSEGYRYLAFISYKREDEEWAKWLQHKLEHYKLPTSVRKANPSLPDRIRPVFKDTTDLSGGVLEKAIQDALDSSKYLIVICSPRAAQSPWVCKEVQEFIDSGREEYIIPFIVDGEPHSKDTANEYIGNIEPDKILRISATPDSQCDYTEEITFDMQATNISEFDDSLIVRSSQTKLSMTPHERAFEELERKKEEDLKLLALSVNPVRLGNNPVALDVETLKDMYKRIVLE